MRLFLSMATNQILNDYVTRSRKTEIIPPPNSPDLSRHTFLMGNKQYIHLDELRADSTMGLKHFLRRNKERK